MGTGAPCAARVCPSSAVGRRIPVVGERAAAVVASPRTQRLARTHQNDVNIALPLPSKLVAVAVVVALAAGCMRTRETTAEPVGGTTVQSGGEGIRAGGYTSTAGGPVYVQGTNANGRSSQRSDEPAQK